MATLSRAAFRVGFPEFSTADDALVDAKLADAHAMVHADAFKTDARHTAALGLKTADLLALSPFGQTARMQSKDGTTTYGKQFAAMVNATGVGCRVV